MIDTYPHAPGHRGVDTSVQAAADLAPDLGRLQSMARRAISDAGPIGLTADELADRLGLDRYTIQPRTSELRRKRVIADRASVGAVMPLGSRHDEAGLLMREAGSLILQRDDGGRWRLEAIGLLRCCWASGCVSLEPEAASISSTCLQSSLAERMGTLGLRERSDQTTCVRCADLCRDARRRVD